MKESQTKLSELKDKERMFLRKHGKLVSSKPGAKSSPVAAQPATFDTQSAKQGLAVQIPLGGVTQTSTQSSVKNSRLSQSPSKVSQTSQSPIKASRTSQSPTKMSQANQSPIKVSQANQSPTKVSQTSQSHITVSNSNQSSVTSQSLQQSPVKTSHSPTHATLTTVTSRQMPVASVNVLSDTTCTSSDSVKEPVDTIISMETGVTAELTSGSPNSRLPEDSQSPITKEASKPSTQLLLDPLLTSNGSEEKLTLSAAALYDPVGKTALEGDNSYKPTPITEKATSDSGAYEPQSVGSDEAMSTYQPTPIMKESPSTNDTKEDVADDQVAVGAADGDDKENTLRLRALERAMSIKVSFDEVVDEIVSAFWHASVVVFLYMGKVLGAVCSWFI